MAECNQGRRGEFLECHRLISPHSRQAMERRADRQLSKSDGVFLYALLKIWKDKKNGNAFERKRLRNGRISAWIAWKDKLQCHESDYGSSNLLTMA